MTESNATSADDEIAARIADLNAACKKHGRAFVGVVTSYAPETRFSTTISIPAEMASDKGMLDHIMLDTIREQINSWSGIAHTHPPTEALGGGSKNLLDVFVVR